MENITKVARGSYQLDILTGRARISGSDLRGEARRWAARYLASRKALCARLVAQGVAAYVSRARSGLLTLHVGEAPTSVPVGEYLGLPLVAE